MTKRVGRAGLRAWREAGGVAGVGVVCAVAMEAGKRKAQRERKTWVSEQFIFDMRRSL